MSANSIQVGGDHYMNKPIQPWDFIVANKMGFMDGNVLKYLSRYPQTRNINDLKKASHYLQKLIELEEGVPAEVTVVEAPVAKQSAPKRPGRPPKAPWGYRSNGQPYVRRPKNWKDD